MDTQKLLDISGRLSDYGVELSTRREADDAQLWKAMGQAFVEISEAIGDLTTELARRS